MNLGFEAVIGLEVHCQLSTDTKIFCGCQARLPNGKSVADLDVNSNTCPVCAGHPGTLPVLNRKAVEYAVMAGLATNCRVNPRSIFARKNYFYPDLPKGYQISQYEAPICSNGWIDIENGDGSSKRVSIQRIHLEEDAGKSVHASGYSVVDLNRAGIPLIEIVSSPDLGTAQEAGAYLRALHAVVTYLGICDGNMQEGNFRCDANVSVRLVGARELGTRTEIKNVNSFRFVEKAIEFEIARQIQVVRSGGRVIQETRSYDSARNLTNPMRSKEEAQDYRYFPDPDLAPLIIHPSWVEEMRRKLPELPGQKRRRWVSDFGLSAGDAVALTSSKAISEFFDQTVTHLSTAGLDARKVGKSVANLITGEVMRLMNEDGLEIDRSRLRPLHVAEVVELLDSGVISSTGAKHAISVAWKNGASIQETVKKEGLMQVSDAGALEVAINKIVASFPKQVEEYKFGKDQLLGFFVGRVMKEMGGTANPSLLQELIRKKLRG